MSPTIQELREAVRKAQAAVDNYEIETTEDEYNDMLDGAYGDVEICGLKYSASHALREIDPTAYRLGKTDWEDSLDKEDQYDYRELVEALEEAEQALADAEEKEESEEVQP